MRFSRRVNPVAIGAALLSAMLVALAGTAGPAPGSPPVEFNRDIRPILSDKCFACHGPDKANRKTALRFDTEEGAFVELASGGHAIVRGDLAKSVMYQRIASDDQAFRMPPAYLGRAKLSDHEIDLIRRWIEQGAKWEKHWSFIPPKRPQLPAVRDGRWPINPIDYFVLARLEQEGLKPSPEADRATLIRRVTLDLTGLPPTPAEVDAFTNDHAPNAYEKVVDRLLQSPRYGERMAVSWLDAARYADTNGYQTDGARTMWRWRDWVIGAFNRNMPFDQFTIEQLAGDMLPNPTLDQKIATGFNRNHRGNGEGGIIPEEFAAEYVVDRVDTTSTVWLGLTMGCARCHDHKYDPIKQKEFYQAFALFNNVPEKGKAVKYGNSPPIIKAPTREQQAQLKAIDEDLAVAEAQYAKLGPKIAAAQAKWEKSVKTMPAIAWSLTEGLVAHYPLDGGTTNARHDPKDSKSRDAVFRDGEPAFAPGLIGQAAVFNGKRFIDAGDVARFGFYDRFSGGAWIYPTGEQGGTILSRMQDTEEGEGYSLSLEGSKVHLRLVNRWLDDALRVETESSLPSQQWHHVMFTYDGSRVASGVKVYVDGKAQKLKVNLDDLNQSFETSEPLRIGSGGGPASRFQGYLQDVRVYHVALSPSQVELAATPDSISSIAGLPAKYRTPSQANKIRECFLETAAPKPIQEARNRVEELRRQKAELIDRIPTTMVMEEMATPRDTFVLIRGAYDRHGDKVGPGIPACLSSLSQPPIKTRLDFAKWLVSPLNPLTARVTVNRYWQMYFGTGLVKTVDDFGSQGEPPSHPELLDWLATEFVRTGWDIKALQKTIVTSATYRQSSQVTPELLQKDPENRLLARGPRLRLPAEVIRDQALYVSGLLAERIGGPSVKPYQPPGLWKELGGGEEYVPSKGEDLYRRSLYSFWKRTSPPPAMITFDSPPRETCMVRATRTNTPLQALTLMNDVTFVEASRALAQRVMRAGSTPPEERIASAFRLATGHLPTPTQRQILLDGFRRHLTTYGSDPRAALGLVSAGESPVDKQLDTREWAAYTVVCSLILNLDETITKE